VFVQNGSHVIEHRGAALALVGIDDPRNWRADDPQDEDLGAALQQTPPETEAFRILLAHRPGAFDGAAPRGIPLTLAGHIHGGQFYLPVIGWSPGRLIKKYVLGQFTQGARQLYVSLGTAWWVCRCGFCATGSGYLNFGGRDGHDGRTGEYPADDISTIIDMSSGHARPALAPVSSRPLVAGTQAGQLAYPPRQSQYNHLEASTTCACWCWAQGCRVLPARMTCFSDRKSSA
jgi:hypothetical protein